MRSLTYHEGLETLFVGVIREEGACVLHLQRTHSMASHFAGETRCSGPDCRRPTLTVMEIVPNKSVSLSLSLSPPPMECSCGSNGTDSHGQIAEANGTTASTCCRFQVLALRQVIHPCMYMHTCTWCHECAMRASDPPVDTCEGFV